MSKRKNYNPYFRVKVRLSLKVGGYELERVSFKFADKAQADEKRAEVEGILAKAINREIDTFSLGSSRFRSEDLYGYKITTKEPDPVPEVDEDDDDD